MFVFLFLPKILRGVAKKFENIGVRPRMARMSRIERHELHQLSRISECLSRFVWLRGIRVSHILGFLVSFRACRVEALAKVGVYRVEKSCAAAPPSKVSVLSA
jgi:hypothetical protein